MIKMLLANFLAIDPAFSFPGTGRIYKPSGGGGGGGSSLRNLEVPIQLTGDVSLTPTSGTRNLYGSQTRFDPSYYDGTVSYFFEASGNTDARIIVQQVGATKTRLYIPFRPSVIGNGGDDLAATVSSTASTSLNWMVWRRDDSAWAGLATTPWTFEAVSACSAASKTCYTTLANTAGTTISEYSTSSTTPVLQYSNSFTSASFSNLTDYEIWSRISNTGGSNYSMVYKAGLWLEISSLSKGEVYFPAFTGPASYNTSTMVELYPANFSNPSVYHESVGYITSGTPSTCVLDMKDNGTLDVATNNTSPTGTVVTNGSVYYNSTSRVIVRQGTVSLTSGNRYFLRTNCATGSETTIGSRFVITFQ